MTEPLADRILDELHRRPDQPRPEAVQMTEGERRAWRLAADKLSHDSRRTNSAAQGQPETLFGLRIEIVERATDGARILPPVTR